MEICKNMQKLRLDSLKIQWTDESEDYDRWGEKIDERAKYK